MKRWFKYFVLMPLSLGLLSPVAAWASWDIFGIGAVGTAAGTIATAAATTAKAASQAAVWIYLIDKTAAMLPKMMAFLLLGICVVCAIVAMYLSKGVADDIRDVYLKEMSKDKPTFLDRAQAVFYEAICSLVLLGMLAFGLFLAYASYSGISGFMK